MKFIVELLAHGKDGEVREVDVPNLIKYSPRMVATEILQLIYEYGQNDNQPQEHPSVSVGDVMRVCDGLYLLSRLLASNTSLRPITSDIRPFHRTSGRSAFTLETQSQSYELPYTNAELKHGAKNQ